MRFVRVTSMLLVLFFIATGLNAMELEKSPQTMKLDLDQYHNVGNIWLRVSNYGFFGSGDYSPQWPSLEYPGGSGIDYLYQGALWFGAKKIRRNDAGFKMYWLSKPDTAVAENDPRWSDSLSVILDTLVTVGFDGDLNLYEFLPAYNPLESTANPGLYGIHNLADTVLTASLRTQQRGVDDDGDGYIDEDPVGFGFPMRSSEQLPTQFSAFGGKYLQDIDMATESGVITTNKDIWFPLGFADLSVSPTGVDYAFSESRDDDGDGLVDEDGYPVSEQDYIGYFYDYSPFGTSGQRDWGSSKASSDHYPLDIRVRQMSYQWSYDYIKNLVYVEFDITNMSSEDILYDCAMGIYMDSDVGPQSWDSSERASDDVSSYVSGAGYEFAYTYDADKDNGLTTGLVGSRVCTPDPDQLKFACWTWKVGDGPDDEHPLKLSETKTANQKYELLTGENPDDSKYTSLRDDPDVQINSPCDTRYLFAFYGDMNGTTTPTDSTWNLAPARTMKIVIAIFPGQTLEELKQQALAAKKIYQNPQNLQTVILPDTCSHYSPYSPPDAPHMYCVQDEDGNNINMYWDNRAEFSVDLMTVSKENVGYQNLYPDMPSYDPNIQPDDPNYNVNAYVDPVTANRLRHDFQGYSIWGRSGKGSSDYWEMKNRWDKIDTSQDILDYNVDVNAPEANYQYFGGVNLGNDTGLPQAHIATVSDTMYYHMDELYQYIPIQVGDKIYGQPIYDAAITQSVAETMYNNLTDPNINTKYVAGLSTKELGAMIFCNPALFSNPSMYLALYEDRLITLPGHVGQNFTQDVDTAHERLCRRYYHAVISNPPKGIEFYISATAWDRGIAGTNPVNSLESGKDSNMKTIFPGPSAKSNMNNIYVVPNPYVGMSSFDGHRENDDKGDRSRRIWFVNLPNKCTIRIYTLAGDLVDKIEHDGASQVDVITLSHAASAGIAPSGMQDWDLLSKHNQVVASGVYYFSVEEHPSGDIKVGKFVIIR